MQQEQESWGRSFRIRKDKSPKAPPSGDNAMTSFPANRKTSISRKWCMIDV